MLLDTNAAMMPFRARFDLLGEIGRAAPGAEVAVPSSVLGELDRLAARGVPHARPARELAGRLRCLPTDERGDAAIVAVALAARAIVVTADRALARRLRAAGIGVLAPRDRTRLELVPARAGTPVAATVKKRPRLDSDRTSDARRRSAPRRPRARVRERGRRRL